MNDKKEIEDWLDLASDKVERNVSIVTPAELGREYLLHISTDTTIRKFTPMIGHNQSKSEDRTTPRICTAPTLLGCMIGYCRAAQDFLQKASTGKDDDERYKGGWKIYSLPFKAALKPGGKILYDADRTDEHWLVAYSKDTVVYTPEHAGNAFYRSIRFVGQSKAAPIGDGELYVEVKLETGIYFSKNIFLAKGYWKITGPIYDEIDTAKMNWRQDGEFVAIAVDRIDYQSAKRAVADLLGYIDTLPAYLNW